MRIENSKIDGVKVLHSEPYIDERGFFNRIFCQEALEVIRPGIVVTQINHSMTKIRGSIRGMHFQYPPHAEMKIVRCIKGSIFDVAVDLRTGSPTFLQWHGEMLSADDMKALVIPEGCAHGFQSLEDTVEMIYLHTAAYCKESEGALRYNDPQIGIQWLLEIGTISKKDMTYPFIPNNYAGIVL